MKAASVTGYTYAASFRASAVDGPEGAWHDDGAIFHTFGTAADNALKSARDSIDQRLSSPSGGCPSAAA
jgi:hypothetical protein